MSANITPIKKLLILRFSSIGDIVLTSPIIRCIKQELKCEVHFLVKQQFQSILKANPYIDRVLAFEKEPTEILSLLKEEHYDFIVDLHKNIRTRRLRAILKRPSAHFPKKNIEKWLLVNFKVNKLPEEHVVDRYFESVKKLGVTNDGGGLDYFIPEKDKVSLESFGLEANGFVALGVGAAHHTKALPQHKLEALLEKLKYPVALLGGPKEAPIGEELAKKGGVNFCGKVNINQTASIIKQAAVVISPDTGIMHIAAAFRKSAISIWGNTVPSFGMYPYYGHLAKAHYQAEVEGLSCRPCSKIGHGKCPKGHFKCMEEQDMDGIVKQVEAYWRA